MFENNTQFIIYNMDVMRALKKLSTNSVDCVITSPPYWALRDYKILGQIGLEEHPQEWINKIVQAFEEIKRILKPTGTVFLNVGDTYYGSYGGFGAKKKSETGIQDITKGYFGASDQKPPTATKREEAWLQPKQRMLLPHRLAIAEAILKTQQKKELD